MAYHASQYATPTPGPPWNRPIDLSCCSPGAEFRVRTHETNEQIKIYNLKSFNIKNIKTDSVVNGNTNTVYINPLNSLRFVLNKMRKDKVKLNSNFYVFTGSTVGVVPLKNKGMYIAKIDKIGTVKSLIR